MENENFSIIGCFWAFYMSPARSYCIQDLEICYEKKLTSRVNFFLDVLAPFSYFSDHHITQTFTPKKESSESVEFRGPYVKK